MNYKTYFEILNKINWEKLSKKIIVAVSGGADSMALTLTLNKYLKEKQIQKELIAITVNHKIRKEAEQEAKQVQIWLNKLAIEHKILKCLPQKGKISQNLARKNRFELLNNYLTENNINNIFLAHHADDQIESFWLRLAKKSGIFGLACMEHIRKNNQIYIIRPFLKLKKNDLKEICQSYGQKWIEDPSNISNKYSRNIVRKNIDNFPIKQKDVLRLIDCFFAIKKNMQKNIALNVKDMIFISNNGYIEIVNKDSFNRLDSIVKKHILSDILNAVRGNKYPPRQKILGNTIQKIKDCKIFTANGCLIEVKDKKIIFAREVRKTQTVTIKKQNFTWDKRIEIMADEKYIGAKISMLKDKNLNNELKQEIEDKIKDKNYKKNYQKLPKIVKNSIPIIYKGKNLLAIPNIGYKKYDIDCNFTPKIGIFGLLR